MLVDLFNQIRKKLVIFVHFKGFNISQKPKSSPLSYFAQKFKFGTKLISDNFYVSVPEWFLFLYFKYWYFRSLKHFWDCDFNFVNVLELHQSMINDIVGNSRLIPLSLHDPWVKSLVNIRFHEYSKFRINQSKLRLWKWNSLVTTILA